MSFLHKDIGRFRQILAVLARYGFGHLVERLRLAKAGYKLRHEGLEDMEGHIDRASNRLAFALVVASIVIGSSIIMQTHMEPMLFGYPAIGVIGYLVTGFLGLWLVWAILRSGRL